MAIVIPSKNIYRISQNNKVFENRIDTVSYVRTDYIIEGGEVFNSGTSFAKEDFSTNEYKSEIFKQTHDPVIEDDVYDYDIQTIFTCIYQKATFSLSGVSDLSGADAYATITTEGSLGSNLSSKGVNCIEISSEGEYDKNVVVPSTLLAGFYLEQIANRVKNLIAKSVKYVITGRGTTSQNITFYFLSRVNVSKKNYDRLTGKHVSSADVGFTTISSIGFNIDGKKESENTTEISNGTGKSPFKLNSNEFFQNETLYAGQPIGDFLASNLLYDYRNGRETASILCSISDYFDENGIPLVSTNPSVKYPLDKITVSIFSEDIVFYRTVKFSIPSPAMYDLKITYRSEHHADDQPEWFYEIVIPKGSTSASWQYYREEYTQAIIVNAQYNTKVPMSFANGMEVVPYIRSADGKDVPMSRKRDGKAKGFRIMKTKKIYDGAVWQELTLQEIL